MASVQERLKLKRAPTDIWSIREQLCLASSVLKSGDQNWMSVSRSLRPIADKDSARPQDWFSQKSCAQQYAYLLENTDIPKRKKRESGETTSESIVRRLTQDRISELSKALTIQREEHQQLKNELNLLKNGTISDEKLQKMWLAIEHEEKEQEQKNKAHIVWLSKRQQSKELPTTQTVTVENIQKKAEIATETTETAESPSPTTQMQVSTQAAGSPTIASLLGSSPKVPGPVIMQTVSPQLHQLVSNTISNASQERPSATAPTLSMLLEQPTAGTQKALQQQLQNSTNLITPKNVQTTVQVQNTIQTRSTRLGQSNPQISQVQQVISTADLSSTEIPQIISNPIDEVMPKVLQMDKDEINEIIGDIEELIKEEITGSPQSLETSSRTVDIIDNLNVQASTELSTERSELRNVDEPVSLSNSPTSEVSIEEIDSSTSNIAEIIGTAIETVESKTNISDPPKEKKEAQTCELVAEDINKEVTEFTISEEIKIETEIIQEAPTQLQNESDNNTDEINIMDHEEAIPSEDESKTDNKKDEEDSSDNKIIDCVKFCEEELTTNEQNIENKKSVINDQETSTVETATTSTDKLNDSSKLEEKKELEPYLDVVKHEKTSNDLQIEEKKNPEDNVSTKKTDEFKVFPQPEIESTEGNSESSNKDVKETESIKESVPLKQESNIEKENKDFKETIEDSDVKDVVEKKEVSEIVKEELDIIIDCEIKKLEDLLKMEKVKEYEVSEKIKIELKKEENEDNEEDYKHEKEEIKKEIENDSIKKESIESVGSVEELDEEEPTLSKLSGGRAMKTYSKKQNATVDSEPENETGGETADYRAWKKSIMLVYNRLATHKYASIFLRPITEDQAPGYHSIIFRPMDLWTIKKNIDNGTIRSTTHFQRDVMLMFQNAIMFNKYNTLVHKMTLEMQEECLQHMQVLVRAAGEASFRRETRTAASISNEATDNSLKRKWTHISSSPHYETESSRMKKRRKSEND
ncbi:PREDICTED: bromodomain-containing protein 8 [Ceratosolen solmsi marchali]|uniref:Bromodomain-containing protein 8 n=1 Tax=Ceratosolen solmsi marchali TaxID=326594 RepID=A0AAJ6YWW8_9HYME|nr:PREDICTED: bromodomain-containing protein 8 [Ceratosolen solmsi marchali]